MLHAIKSGVSRVWFAYEEMDRALCREFILLCRTIKAICMAIFEKIKQAYNFLKRIIPDSKHRIKEGPEHIVNFPQVIEDGQHNIHMQDLELMNALVDFDLTSESYYFKEPLTAKIMIKMQAMIETDREDIEFIKRLLDYSRNSDLHDEEVAAGIINSNIEAYERVKEKVPHTARIFDLKGAPAHEMRRKLKRMLKKRSKHIATVEGLITKCQSPKFQRKHFNGHELIVFDRATFELVKEWTPRMTDLFNSGRLDGMAQEIQDKFGWDYCEALIAKMLAQTVAYNTRLHGRHLTLPVKNAEGVYENREYTIRRYLLGEGLPTYVLECLDEEGRDIAKPWMVVRGTETSNVKTTEGKNARPAAFESLMADIMHEEGVAEGVLEANMQHGRVIKGKPQESLMHLFSNRQFNLSGHSLGGNIVNQLAAHFYHNVSHAYGFSSPGVSNAIAKLWEQNAKGDAAKKLFNLQTEGDMVPAAGKRLIGEHFAIDPLLKPHKADAIHHHVLFVLNKPFKICKIDKKAEEKQIGRIAMEFTRVSLGTIAKKVMKKLKWSLPEWHVTRNIRNILTA